MSKLSEQLRAIKIYNTWGLLVAFGNTKDAIAVEYHTPPSGRAGWGSITQTRVWSPHFKVNPNNRRYGQTSEDFIGHKAQSMPAALEWASKKYGITEWATCPTDRGTKIPAYVLKAAKLAVKDSPDTTREQT